MRYLLDVDFSTQTYEGSLHHLIFMGVFFIIIIVVAIFWLRRG
jgi:hypothetical protein